MSYKANTPSFGALGDGKTIATKAIQQSIDECHAAGGGEVLVPAGTYVVGTLELKSHVTLRLLAGARLLGSPDRNDYTIVSRPFPDEQLVSQSSVPFARTHLIYAKNARHVSIVGEGIIDGNGPAFFGPIQEEHPLKRFRVRGWRPGEMVAFYDCEHILIQGIHLCHSPMYNIMAYCCTGVRIVDVNISNHPSTPNGDGIDPICCHDVHIHGCTIDTADDSIAIYSGFAMAANDVRSCENVVISDCILRSRCNAIRIGYAGDMPIQNIVAHDVIVEARAGVAIQSVCPFNVKQGTPIEHIILSNMIMHVARPLLVIIDPRSIKPAGIRHLAMDNLRIYARMGIGMIGSPAIPIEDVTLNHLKLHLAGTMRADGVGSPIPEKVNFMGNDADKIPHAIYCRHVRNAAMTDVRVEWGACSGPWQSALHTEQCADMAIQNCILPAAPALPAPCAAGSE